MINYCKPGQSSDEEFRDCIYDKVSKRRGHIKFSNDMLLRYDWAKDRNDTSSTTEWNLKFLLGMMIKYSHEAQAQSNQTRLDAGLSKPAKVLHMNKAMNAVPATSAEESPYDLMPTGDGGAGGETADKEETQDGVDYLMVTDETWAVYVAPAVRNETS